MIRNMQTELQKLATFNIGNKKRLKMFRLEYADLLSPVLYLYFQIIIVPIKGKLLKSCSIHIIFVLGILYAYVRYIWL